MGLKNGRRVHGAVAKAATSVVIGALAWMTAGHSTALAQDVVQPDPLPADADAPRVAARQALGLAPDLQGRPVEDVRVIGNRLVSTAEILQVVRTGVGQAFDADTVAEDYQRIYNLRRFANVEAKAEPTREGVIVVFEVREQSQINAILVVGNLRIPDATIRGVINLEPGQAIEPFRIGLARQAIEQLYRDRNFPRAQVTVVEDALSRSGNLIFKITEGPAVREIDIVPS